MEQTFLRDSGKALFCLKLADSRQTSWRLEQRFDKLFEALEILCRYISHSEPAMASKVAEALGYISPSAQGRMDGLFMDDQLGKSLKELARRVIAGLEYEASTAEYATDHLHRIRQAVSYFRANLEAFEESRIGNAGKAAAALLRFFVTLRNSRFHAYAGTSGSIIGYEWPLKPVCDTFEHVLLLIAAGRFGLEVESLADFIESPAVRESPFAYWLKREG